jgi:hypothetical protein
VNEDSQVLLSILCGARNHIDALNEADVEVLEALKHAFSSDIGEYTRDA